MTSSLADLCARPDRRRAHLHGEGRPGAGQPVSAPFQRRFSAPAYRAEALALATGPEDDPSTREQSMSRTRRALAAATMAVVFRNSRRAIE